MKDDATLLQSYVGEGSQAAFAELVHRHLGLVYQAALRHTAGDPHRAEEVAQLVFTDLARKAATLSRHPLLVAWLHTSTHYAASQLRRTEQRRRAREQESFAMNEAGPDPVAAADWKRLRPLIDDALQSLGERDRAAVLLRFFENLSYAELGAALSLSEEAARARVNRSLEKLRSTLARRGLPSTASALTLALAQPALASAPAGLAAQVTAASLAASAGIVGAAAGAGLGAVSVLGTAKIAAGIAGAAALLSVGVVFYPRPPIPAKTAAMTVLSPADFAAILQPVRLGPAEADAALAAYLALPLLIDPAPAAELQARRARLRALLILLPVSHFERFLATLYARLGWAEDELRRLAFTAWAEQAPADAARWAEALAPAPTLNLWQRARLVSEATGLWARLDFDAARAWIATIADVPLSHGVTSEILAQLARSDPDKALSLAPDGDDPFARDTRLAIFRAWGEKNPAAALIRLGPAILEEKDPKRAVPPLLAAWILKEPDAALAWALAQPEPPPEDAHRAVLQSIGWDLVRIPGAVRPFIDKIAARADLPGREGVLKNLFASWVQRDTTAALAWIDTLPDLAERSELVSWSLGLVPQDRPDEFLAAVRRLPDAAQREDLIAKRLADWAAKDADAALAWLSGHDDAELAAAARQTESVLLGKLADSNLSAALDRWQALPPGADRAQAAISLATAWGKTDPAAAARWLADLSAGDKSQTPDPALLKALSPLASRWAWKDPAAFAAWAETLPDETRRQGIIATLGQEFIDDLAGADRYESYINRPDPPPRAAYASQLAAIANPAIREQGLTVYLRGWLYSDYHAARAWIESHDALPPEAAARLLTQAEPR